MRIRRSDLEAVIAAGSAPNAERPLGELTAAVEQASDAVARLGDPELVALLRALADAANRLADALEGPAH